MSLHNRPMQSLTFVTEFTWSRSDGISGFNRPATQSVSLEYVQVVTGPAPAGSSRMRYELTDKDSLPPPQEIEKVGHKVMHLLVLWQIQTS